MPHVITITGASGAGKSTVVRYLLASANKSFRPELVAKYTTRPRRATDDPNMVEVICRDAIPPKCDLVYEHCEERYGLRMDTLFDIVASRQSPIVILNDVRAVEDVRNCFKGLVRSVFIFREVPTRRRYIELAMERGIKDAEEPERRFHKAQAIYRIYIENIHLFDHVILNSGTFEQLEAQVKQIVKGLEQDLNWPLRKRE